VNGSATGIRGDSTLVRDIGGGFTITDTVSDDVKYLGTERARLGGVPFTSRDVLLYGTAGLAWERVNRIDTQNLTAPAVTQVVTTTDPRDHFGWVAGAGAEFRLGASNWIGRLEYLHYDFGTVESATTVVATGAGSFADSGGRQTIDVVRGGVSYKF
jgi:outer membrane immunogenic protein